MASSLSSGRSWARRSQGRLPFGVGTHYGVHPNQTDVPQNERQNRGRQISPPGQTTGRHRPRHNRFPRRTEAKVCPPTESDAARPTFGIQRAARGLGEGCPFNDGGSAQTGEIVAQFRPPGPTRPPYSRAWTARRPLRCRRRPRAPVTITSFSPGVTPMRSRSRIQSMAV